MPTDDAQGTALALSLPALQRGARTLNVFTPLPVQPGERLPMRGRPSHLLMIHHTVHHSQYIYMWRWHGQQHPPTTKLFNCPFLALKTTPGTPARGGALTKATARAAQPLPKSVHKLTPYCSLNRPLLPSKMYKGRCAALW